MFNRSVSFKYIFRKTNLRKKLWDDLVIKTENETGEPIPEWIKDIINDGLDTYESMRNEFQFFTFLLKKIKEVKEILSRFTAPSILLNSDCKIFLDKIINDSYHLTKNKGIERRLWKYMNQINVMSDHLTCLEKINSELTNNSKIYELLTFYERFFELTLKILSEYAFVIASSAINETNSKFIKIYNKTTKRGRSVDRNDIIAFFKETHYLEMERECKIFNSRLRNGAAHFDFYPIENKIKIYNQIMTIEEFREDYLQLLYFHSYLLSRSLKGNKWFSVTTVFEKDIIQYLKSNHILKLIFASVNKKDTHI